MQRRIGQVGDLILEMCKGVIDSFDIFHRKQEDHNYSRDDRNFRNRTDEDSKPYHVIPRFWTDS